jgi:WD40 repeat protein
LLFTTTTTTTTTTTDGDGTVRVWDLRKLRNIATLTANGPCAFSPLMGALAASGGDGVGVHATSKGWGRLMGLGNTGPAAGVAWSADGAGVLVTEGGRIKHYAV